MIQQRLLELIRPQTAETIPFCFLHASCIISGFAHISQILNSSVRSHTAQTALSDEFGTRCEFSAVTAKHVIDFPVSLFPHSGEPNMAVWDSSVRSHTAQTAYSNGVR